MKSRKRTGSLIVIGILLLAPVILPAAEDGRKVSASLTATTIGLGQQTILKVSIEAAQSVKPVAVPSVRGLKLDYTGREQSFRMVNGKVWRGMVLHFTVSPREAGNYYIPGLTFQVDGEEVKSNPVKLTVQKDPVQSQQGPSGMPGPFGMNNPFSSRKPEPVTVRPVLEVHSETTRIGQPVLLRYYLQVSRGTSFEVAGIDEQPEVKDFILKRIEEELPEKEVPQSDMKRVHVMTFALVPTATGTRRVRGGSIVLVQGTAFGFSRRQKVSFPPTVITVLSLPVDGRPDGYQGDVGTFTMKLDKDKIEVEAFQEKTLHVTVKGKGNLITLTEPVVKNLCEGIVLEPATGDAELSVEEDRLAGSRTFEFRVLGREDTRCRDVTFELPVYDPAEKNYSLLAAGPLDLTITPAREGERKERIDKEDGAGKKGAAPWMIALPILFALAVAGGIFLLIRDRRRMKEAGTHGQGKRPAPGERRLDPDEVLRECAVAAMEGENEEFLRTAGKLVNYLRDRTGRSDAELEEIAEELNRFRFAGLRNGEEGEREFMERIYRGLKEKITVLKK